MKDKKNQIKTIIRKIPWLSKAVKLYYDEDREKNLQKKIKLFLEKNQLPFTKEPPPFYSVGHEPTIRCNLRCKMCYQAQTRNLRLSELNTEEVLLMYNKLKDKVKLIKLVGGEPMVRQDIFNLIKFLDSHDKKIILQTNCTLINENNIGEIKKYRGLTDIATSLDGSPEVHDEIRGVPNTFARLKRAIQLLQKERPDIPITVFGMFLPNENIDNLYDLVDTCRDLGIGTINILFEQVYSPAEEEATKKIFAKVFGWQPTDYRLNTQVREKPFKDNVDIREIKKKLDKIRNYGFKRKCFVNYVPYSFYKNLDRYFGRKTGRVFCHKLLNPELRINQKGDVVWCDVIEKSFGNLLEKSPDEIWLSDEYQRFREYLYKNSLPICSRCCKAVYI